MIELSPFPCFVIIIILIYISLQTFGVVYVLDFWLNMHLLAVTEVDIRDFGFL